MFRRILARRNSQSSPTVPRSWHLQKFEPNVENTKKPRCFDLLAESSVSAFLLVSCPVMMVPLLRQVEVVSV